MEDDKEFTPDEGDFAQRTPPYVSYRSLTTLWADFKGDGIPPRIDRSVLRRFSGGLAGQILGALRSLGMMNEQGVPTEALRAIIAKFETPEYAAELRKVLHNAYPFLQALDLKTATPSMFAEAFKAGTNAKEDVLRKCRTFYLHAAKAAGMEIGPRIEKGSYPRTSNGARAKRKPRVERDETVKKAGQDAHERVAETSAKPLEYQLIDLMKEPDIDDAVRQSIWALVQYLTARSARNQGPQ